MWRKAETFVIGLAAIYIGVKFYAHMSPVTCDIVSLFLPLWDCSLSVDIYSSPAFIALALAVFYLIVVLITSLGVVIQDYAKNQRKK